MTTQVLGALCQGRSKGTQQAEGKAVLGQSGLFLSQEDSLCCQGRGAVTPASKAPPLGLALAGEPLQAPLGQRLIAVSTSVPLLRHFLHRDPHPGLRTSLSPASPTASSAAFSWAISSRGSTRHLHFRHAGGEEAMVTQGISILSSHLWS